MKINTSKELTQNPFLNLMDESLQTSISDSEKTDIDISKEDVKQPINKKELINPFIFESEEAEKRWNFVEVDIWIPEPQDELFKHVKGSLITDVSGFYNVNNENLNYFMLSTKKCYNNLDMRMHLTRYLNYFEKYYDLDKEYMVSMFYIKYLLDFEPNYNKECLKYDINRYILKDSMIEKARHMVDDNYKLELTYRNIKNSALQYTDEHAKILLTISILINCIIPLVTHFAFINKVDNIDMFLLEMFDPVLNISETDIYNKLYETSYTNIMNNYNKNEGVWNKQDIRGKNTTTHALFSLNNIILNIIPKYTFIENIISFNYSSILTSTKYQISDIAYEFNYIPLSSSKMDADNTSEFDRINVACSSNAA